MQFERGQDPKKTMRIGLKANAPLIGTLLQVQLEYDYVSESISKRQSLSIVDSKKVIYILKGIADGTISQDDFVFEQDKTGKENEPNGICYFHDYKGRYLRYVNRYLPQIAIDPYDHFNEEYIFLIP